MVVLLLVVVMVVVVAALTWSRDVGGASRLGGPAPLRAKLCGGWLRLDYSGRCMWACRDSRWAATSKVSP